MDDHLSILVNTFDGADNFDFSEPVDPDVPKTDYGGGGGVVCTTTGHNAVAVASFQGVMQTATNGNKEIVTVNPIFKLEADILGGHKAIKSEEITDKKQQIVEAKQPVMPQKRSRGHIDRYNGLTEDEVMQRKLPDYLREGLDLIVVGINPSMTSASVGHHYAGIGNHFWTCITEAGLVPEQVTCYDDYRMVDYGIGFTNVCSRPTKGAAEISRKEMKAGAMIMLEKMRKYRPKIAVFNGKGIYEAFVGHKNFYMGKQPKTLDGTDIIVFVMPSSSARCAQLPRAEDKLPFFIALRKLRDYVKGRISHLSDQEVIFTDYTEFRVTQPDPKSLRKAERRRKRKAEQMMALANTDQLVGITKPRRNKTLMTSIQSQKSTTLSNNITLISSAVNNSISKDNEYSMVTHDLTTSNLQDDTSSQIEIPLALLNQSNGNVISLVPSDLFINNSLGGINIANQNSVFNLNKANNTLTSSKPIILQQDASGLTYMLTSSPVIQQNSAITVPQIATISGTQPATIMPWGGNTFAIIQPNQIVTQNQPTNDNNNASGLSWNGSNISVQGSPQIIAQPSNLIYQKTSNTNTVGCQQIICTAATLQQLLQQQQQQQIQIVNPLTFSQPLSIPTQLGIPSNSFGSIQIQQFSGCLSDSITTDQITSNNNDQLLHQDSLCQPSCSMTPSSSDNVVPASTSSNQNCQSNSCSTTSDTPSSNQPGTIIGYSVAPNSHHSSQSIGIGSTQNFAPSQNLTLAYISNQPSSQPHNSAFSSLSGSNATHIVIPLSCSNLNQSGSIIQFSDSQSQRLFCAQGATTNIANCFTNCGVLANGSITLANTGSGNANNNTISTNNSLSHTITLSTGSSTTNSTSSSQMQTSHSIAASSSTSGVSSDTCQNDLDLISSTSGVAESSTTNSHIFHPHGPVQLADCEDQLVQCSSSDEKLVYAAL